MVASSTDQPAEPRGASVIITVIQVLRCFTVDQPLQGVTEIAGKVGLHKSSISRILATLETEQLVERDDQSRKYRLGLGLLSIAGPLLADLDVRRIALPVLRELARSSGETAALVVWSGHQAVTVEQVPSPQQIKHTNPLGTRYQTAADASVQVFLTDLPSEEVAGWLTATRSHLGGTSDGELDALIAELGAMAARGYAVNHGVTSPDEVGVAAPVRDHRGEVVAAILIAAPAYRVPLDSVGELGQQAVEAAAEVSQQLGSTADRSPPAGVPVAD